MRRFGSITSISDITVRTDCAVQCRGVLNCDTQSYCGRLFNESERYAEKKSAES